MKNIISLLIFLAWFNQIKAQITPSWATSYGANYPVSINQSDMEVDKNGNVYIVGYANDTSFNLSGIILKYFPGGQIDWVQNIDSLHYYSKIVVDDSSNVIITGHNSGIGLKTIKFDSDGNIKWNRTYSSVGWGTFSWAITTDNLFNVYITGHANGNKFTTVKYDLNGNLLWDAIDTAGVGQGGSYITLDENRNVYIAARGYDTSGAVASFTIKYDTLGNKKWEKRSTGNFIGGCAFPSDLKYHNSGFIYVLATSNNCNSGEGDYFIVKYDTLGNEIWNSSYSFSTYYDFPRGLVLDKAGNAYITGVIYPTGGTIDSLATIKINKSGIFEWKRTYSSGFYNNDEATGIAIDSLENIFVIGKSSDSFNDENYVTIKYDTLGNQIWIARYEHTFSSWDIPNSIDLDENGNIYVSGTTIDQNSSGILTIKYSSTVGINENDLHQYQTLDVSPNPFTYSFSLKSKNKFNNANFQMFDVTGKLVLEISDINENNIVVQRGQLKNGLYFFRIIENNEVIANGKVIAN